jgi:hypothetical protein
LFLVAVAAKLFVQLAVILNGHCTRTGRYYPLQ